MDESSNHICDETTVLSGEKAVVLQAHASGESRWFTQRHGNSITSHANSIHAIYKKTKTTITIMFFLTFFCIFLLTGMKEIHEFLKSLLFCGTKA